MAYSYKKTLQKGLKYFVLFALPILVDRFIIAMPDIANLTLGVLLVMLCNYLKVKMGFDRIP